MGELSFSGEIQSAKLVGWSDYGVGNEKPIIGGIYRHFKGGVYQVIDIVRNEANREEELVIYRSLMYGEKWARELSLFTSDVDAEKYPEFAGQKRLEFVGHPKFLMGGH